MLSNKITFYAPEVVIADKEIYPEPIKKNIPEYYKKLSTKKDTVKNCMPFLDTLTTGYALKLTADIRLIFNTEKEDTSSISSHYLNPSFNRKHDLNVLDSYQTVHPRWQLEGSNILTKNRNQAIQKIINPWTIKTPPGYSCLFLPPMNNKDDRFEILPGIVDTDNFDMEINFPYVVNGDRYPYLDTTLKKGLIFAQCIPFKRDSWKMNVNKLQKIQKNKDKFFYKWLTMFQHKYKKFSWNKKNFT